ncbi:DUF4190 domain-containing protein [Cellulomonas sp. NS3]|uniref:DUF4190 domain-containing protein n=1 Tax=Cellulomonas sp. NS3 TaxID=2973977 RepID=UPI002161CFBF|nr:DUF4190 domain-containing protein [Cellulomonas sp. NS3]
MTTPVEPTPDERATGPAAPSGPSGSAPDAAPVDLSKPRAAEQQPAAPGAEPAAPGVQPAPYGAAAPPYPAPAPYPAQPYAGQPYPGQPYPGQPYPGQPYPPAYAYPKNQLGVWSLVLGIVGIVVGCVFLTGIPAVILGNNAKRAVAAGEANNLGVAQAGIVLGWISIALGVVAVGFFVLYLVGMAGVLGLSFLSTGSGY